MKEVARIDEKEYKLTEIKEINFNTLGNADNIKYIESLQSFFIIITKAISCITYPDYKGNYNIEAIINRKYTIDIFDYLEKANKIAAFYWQTGTKIYF